QLLGGGPGGDLVAVDTCGQVKWRVGTATSYAWTNGRHIIDRDQLVSVDAGQTLSAALLADGSPLWTLDLRPSLGVCPDTRPSNCAMAPDFRVQDIALGNDGRFYVTGDYHSDGLLLP